MKLVVRKWGNSAAVRIPAVLMEAAHLSVDQVVEMREEGGQLVIAPVREVRVDLDALVAGITEENLHEAVDFGGPVGKEIW